MSDAKAPATPILWVGRVLSALTVPLFCMSAYMKLSHNQQVIDGLVAKGGFPESSLTPIGIAEISCLVIYLIPQTSVLGAILLTAYLGGAVCTHVHGGEGFLLPVAVGVVVWLGLFLREPRLHALVPLRRG